MIKIFQIGLLLITLSFNVSAFAAKPKAQNLDKIVAVVNEDVITNSELSEALTLAKAQMQSPPSDSVLKKQVLDQLINKKLQLDLAKQAGIGVTNADLDDAIDNVARQNGMTIETLYVRLSQEGMSVDEYRAQIRDQLTLNKIQQQEVISRVRVSPQEVQSFMQSKMWRDNTNKEYHIEDILIPIPDTPSTEQVLAAKKQATEVVEKLNQGENFKTIAQSVSGDKHALEGGDLGWRKLPEIPSAFAEQVVQMQVKEIVGPIQTPNGFHIIRLAGTHDTESSKPNLDAKQVERLLLERKFDEALQNWVSKLRGQAYIVMPA